jgi:hypothetical protein
MNAIVRLGLLCVLSCVGCANLKVTKITATEKGTCKDHCTKGFRYYLSRPYVVVEKPVCVSEEISLLVVDTKSDLEGQVPAQLLEQVKMLLDSPATVSSSAGGSPGTMAEDGAGPDKSSEDEQTKQKTQGTAYTLSPEDLQPDNTPTVDLKGSIKVVFLPDMDEQYAVHNTSFLGKIAYRLAFKDGWQLQGVSADTDNTAVAIALLKAVQTGIDTAKKVAMKRNALAQALKKPAEPAAGNNKAAMLKDGKDDSLRIMEVATCTYLKPGLYRINKPWEMDGGIACDQDGGFLQKLGLETYVTTEVRPAVPQAGPTSAPVEFSPRKCDCEAN